MASSARSIRWTFAGTALTLNAVGLRVTPVMSFNSRVFLDAQRKIVYGKKANDPRVVRYHTIELTFAQVTHEHIRLIEEQFKFFNTPFQVKIKQFDYYNEDRVTTVLQDAAKLRPSGFPIAGNYTKWFLPYRSISNDSGDEPALYVNSVLQSSGFTWDYDEGKVTFDTAKASSDDIRAYFVWKPYVKITAFDPNALAGKVRHGYRYSPSMTLEEVGPVTTVEETEDLSNFSEAQLQDTFTRADSGSNPGNLETGQTWTVQSGTFGIASNKLKIFASGVIETAAPSGVNDKDVSMAVYRNGVVGVGPDLRFRRSGSDRIVFGYDGTAYSVRKISGTTTTLGSYATSAADGDVIRVVDRGNSIVAYLNGIVRVSVSSSEFKTNLVGIEGLTNHTIDDFELSY